MPDGRPQPPVTFRAVAVDDGTAHMLLAEYFADRAAGFPVPGAYVTRWPDPEEFEPPVGVFLLAKDAATPDVLGCGGIRRIGDPDAGIRYEVKHLWVRPHARGRGLGRALLAELESRGRDLGATELVLDTNDSLEAAGGLYRSSGFDTIEPYNDNPNANHWYRKVL